MTEERLTPTEKLKAARQAAKRLSEALGKVVTYDDDTTKAILDDAEVEAVNLLQIIHDEDNHEDIMHAVFYRLTGENL